MEPNNKAPLKATIAAITLAAGVIFANTGVAEQDASVQSEVTIILTDS